jgi:oleate hydratase
MYYSNGNYEAFARPEKPKGVEQKSAYLIGSGLASLAAASFLIRDGQMKGEHIHILEAMALPGGACDGINDPTKGFIIRGGREMENHFECLWDLFRSIPSLETEGLTVLDEFYRLNKHDPNYSLMRASVNRGADAHTDGKFTLSDDAAMQLAKLFMTKDESLYDKTLDDVFDDAFYRSNFWLYWQTMFAFEKWHSALEMKLYLQRFIHHIGGLPDFSALKFTKYNQYESLILPLVHYLKSNGVHFQYNTQVLDIQFDIQPDRKMAKQIIVKHNGNIETVDLIADDLVFITNGSCTERSTLGDDTHVPVMLKTAGKGDSWELWQKIAKQDPAFGHPEKFCSNLHATNWESATITTLDDRIPKYIQKMCKRDPFSGKVVTGGIITVKDSSWLMSYTLNRQPHFKSQPENQLVVWLYGLYTDIPGDYIRKPMKDCTGNEIVQEWLYHMGVPTAQIEEMSQTGAHCIPCMMPYITAFFMPRSKGDRPKVIPEGAVNFAFIGQFADTVRDTVFTTEYSVRTGMEAVYTLLNIDRGVPEVFNSCYDVRMLLDATAKMMDGRKITDVKLPFLARHALKFALKKSDATVIGDLLKRYQLI